MSSKDWIAAGAAVLAVGVAGASYYESRRANDRLDRDARMQVANRVALSEAPKFAYDQHEPSTPGGVYWVVMNYSSSQVEDTWVEGKNGTSVVISGVQPCSLYALPETFDPAALHFRDGAGRWRRERGALPTLDGKAPPPEDTANSPWFLDLPNCP